MLDTTTVPDLNMYLALGRAALKDREAAQDTGRRAQRGATPRRHRLGSGALCWSASSRSIPPDFLTYVVEPVKGYREGLNSEGVRGLIYDLTPLGLAQVTAFVDLSKDDGISWLAPNVVESATGEKFFTPYTDVHRSTLERQGVTFYEVLAQCAELVEEVARHNEWLTSPKPVGPPAEEPSGPNYLNQQISHEIELPAEDALAVAAKAVYPVLRVGTNRHEVHAAGELDAIEFGHKYGAKGWADRCAVHTFKLLDVPDFGELYVYLTLVPVKARMWAELVARERSADRGNTGRVRQKMLAALSTSQDGLAWLELPAAVKITEADVRAIALVQEIRDRHPDMTIGEFHRLLYDAGWWVTMRGPGVPRMQHLATADSLRSLASSCWRRGGPRLPSSTWSVHGRPIAPRLVRTTP